MKADLITDVVRELVGPVDPVGSSHEDAARLKNLTALIEVTDNLLGYIERIVPNKNRSEHSMKIAGENAARFIAAVRESLEDSDET